MRKIKDLAAFVKHFRVSPGRDAQLSKINSAHIKGIKDKDAALEEMVRIRLRLAELQSMLYAQARHSVLVVLQAMDTGGKDGVIRDVFGALNPHGLRVISFKVPTPEEQAHDFLWRIHREVPPRAMLHVFNRSHYEDVLVVRVRQLAPPHVIRNRYDQINAFEKHLAENGVTLLKIFLHISKDEQKERLQARLDDPAKQWKFNPGDLDDRKRWPQYMRAYETALTRCSTPWAPWHVIPADRKWYRNLVVARILLATLEALDLRYPPAPPGLSGIRIRD